MTLILVMPIAIMAENIAFGEISIGPSGYLGCGVKAAFERGKMNYSLSADYSRSAVNDYALGAGAEAGYDFSGDIKSSVEYVFSFNRSYLLYEALVVSTLYSYVTAHYSHLAMLNADFSFEKLTLSPNAGFNFNVVEGILEAGAVSKKISAQKVISSRSFIGGAFGLSASLEIGEMVLASAGASKDVYGADIGAVLDAAGSTQTVTRDTATLKTAVQFPDFGVNAGVALALDKVTVDAGYSFTAFYHSANENSSDYSQSFISGISFETEEGAEAGLSLETLRTHYTDGYTATSLYLKLYANFPFR